MMISKNDARDKARKYRSELSARDSDKFSMKICDTFMSMDEFKEADVLYVYKSVNNEVDVDYLVKKALEAGKTVALPKVNGKNILFYKITDDADLIYGYMGIPEPVANPYNLVEVNDGVILVPGLAFDADCGRAGYGGGFYDKFLSGHPELIKIGVAYDAQVFDELETEGHDIKVDMVITENRVFRKAVMEQDLEEYNDRA